MQHALRLSQNIKYFYGVLDALTIDYIMVTRFLFLGLKRSSFVLKGRKMCHGIPFLMPEASQP